MIEVLVAPKTVAKRNFQKSPESMVFISHRIRFVTYTATGALGISLVLRLLVSFVLYYNSSFRHGLNCITNC